MLYIYIRWCHWHTFIYMHSIWKKSTWFDISTWSPAVIQSETGDFSILPKFELCFRLLLKADRVPYIAEAFIAWCWDYWLSTRHGSSSITVGHVGHGVTGTHEQRLPIGQRQQAQSRAQKVQGFLTNSITIVLEHFLTIQLLEKFTKITLFKCIDIGI